MSLEVKQKQPFIVTHRKDATYEPGLRGFFEYRDLGIAAATGGAVGAHVIRSVKTLEGPGERHHHVLDFQLVYVLRGWVRFDYEGQGEVLLEEGSCALQPPGIKHTELGHSSDVEILEITIPARFGTSTDAEDIDPDTEA
jgi:mannose-6-phosphate isomerase-like protein (cupin superfamily)